MDFVFVKSLFIKYEYENFMFIKLNGVASFSGADVRRGTEASRAV